MYDFAKKPAEAVKKHEFRFVIFLGAANEKEIYFTSCGSESANMAIKGVLNCNKEKNILLQQKS